MPPSAIIQVSDLTKTYGSRRGIDNIAMSVEEGAIHGFLGPNGAGKSTAIRVLLGFLRQSSGRATIFGEDCWSRSHVIKRDVSYVAGDLRLYPWMTGRSAIRFVERVRRRPLRQSAEEFFERFELDPSVAVRRMSRGMRQKLGLILALAPRPKLFILDEPTSGLDPLMQDELGRCLREFADKGHTVLFSSHALAEVDTLCDRVSVIRRGRIVADERLEMLRARAKRAITLRFSGEPPAVVPACLNVLARSSRQWDAQLEGEMSQFLEWLPTQGIADITIGPPDLDRLFRSFYSGEGASE